MAPRPRTVPPLALVERCWRLKTAAGTVFTCGIFQDAHGLEVRGCREPRLFLFSQRATDIEHAREIAEASRLSTIEQFGPVEVLPLEASAP